MPPARAPGFTACSWTAVKRPPLLKDYADEDSNAKTRKRKIRLMKKLHLLSATVVLASIGPARLNVPALINYQGQLVDGIGSTA